MRKAILSLYMLLAFIATAFAQTRQVTGKVVDKGGEALIGVSVGIKGSTVGTSTDAGGNFKIKVSESGNVVLVFKYLGFKTREVSLGKQSQLTVRLEEDVTSLQEVQINVGYGITVPKEGITGSVSAVSAKQIADVPVSSAAEALAGRLAGVQVTTTEGSPGAEIQIRVRGGSSITGDNRPLYIVDGIQVEDALSLISPQEIENITVLKDAASAAIYGSRGANGVVLITTKGGKEMRTQVSYNGFAGVRRIVNKLDVMSPYDFVKYQYQIYNYNTNQQTRDAFVSTYGFYDDLELYKDVPAADWQGRVFGRDALSQTHVLNLTGGSKSTTFAATVNHVDEDGIMLGSGYERTLASFKLDHKVSDRLKIGVNTRYSRQRIDGVGTSSTGTQGTNRLRNAVRFSPFIAPGQEGMVDEFDAEYANLTNLTSPVVLAEQELKYDYRNDLFLNGYFDFSIIKNLNFRSLVGITTKDRKINAFNGVATSEARQNANLPIVNRAGSEGFSFNTSNTLTFKTKIKKDHSLDFLAGQEYVERRTDESFTKTKYLPADITAEQAFAGIQKASPPAGLIQDSPTTGYESDRLISLFGRANYNYKGRYMATFNTRADWSSLFAKGNRLGIFPSASIAWRIYSEPFMERTKGWLSDLKFRVSTGALGNNRVDMDGFKIMFESQPNDSYAVGESLTPGFASTNFANPNIKWETTISRNLGVDFAFLKNRLSGSVDFYLNNTKDLLLQFKVPQTTGYTNQLRNIGKTENRGVEIQLAGAVLQKKDFTWTANYNMSFNKNKIVSLGNDPLGIPINSYLESSGWVSSTYQDYMVEVGKPIGQFYGYVTDGFYTVDDFDYNATTQAYTLKSGIANSRDIALGNREPQPGDLKLKKLSSTTGNYITTADRTVLGNAQPKFIGGFNQNFTYKNFDMSVFMNFSVGNKVYNANKIEFTTQYLYKDNNMLSTMNNRWKWFDESGVLVKDPDQLRAMNANTTLWTPPGGQYFLHSYAIEDGSFLRISNVTLGYSLPQALLTKTKAISKFRVYATVNNLWTITGYSGYDPEANTRRSNPLTPGVDYAAYPRSRFIVAGLNVTF